MWVMLGWFGVRPFIALRRMRSRMAPEELRKGRWLEVLAVSPAAAIVAWFGFHGAWDGWTRGPGDGEAWLMIALLAISLFSWFRLEVLTHNVGLGRRSAGETSDRASSDGERPSEG